MYDLIDLIKISLFQKSDICTHACYLHNLLNLHWFIKIHQLRRFEQNLAERRFEQNLAERNMKENKIDQEILDCDPLVSVPLGSGNG